MKTITKNTLLMPLLILALSLVIGFGSSDVFAEEFGSHQINFLGASYDPGADATTFTYQVIAGDGFIGIDDWILELSPECFGERHIIDASELFVYVVDDPPAYITGIKFTEPYGAGESRTVWFRLSGDLSTTPVRVILRQAGCQYIERRLDGPDCPGEPGEPPPEGEGMSPGYWKNQLAIYLGYKGGKLKEPDVESYAAQYGYTAVEAYAILSVKGGSPVDQLHKQLLAAKLSTAAEYLLNIDQLLEDGQYMVAHPGEFTDQEILDAKDLFESLHD